MTLPVHRISLAGAVALAACVAARASEGDPLRVRGVEGRVAVYATTNALREAVAWMPAEAELAVVGDLPDEGTWVQVVPPEPVSLWVYRELVRNGSVLADKVRVRSGAGLNFHPVGTLNKGDRVEVRGTYGDWVKIKPPSGLGFWVLRDQVEPLAVMPPEGALPVDEEWVTNTTPVTVLGAATNAAPVVLVPPPAELAALPLAEGADQGVRVLLTGVLDWGTVGDVAAPFSLVVRQPDGDTRPVCHIFCSPEQGKPNVGSTVTVRGTRWRVKGSELPAVVAESLRPLE